MDLYQAAINFDKSGFPGLAKKSSRDAGTLLNYSMDLARHSDLVDLPMNLMEVTSGSTIEFDEFGNPYIRNISTFERSLSLVGLALTGGGGILAGLPGAITGSYLSKAIKNVAKYTDKIIKPQIIKKLKRANKSLDEATEIAIKTTDEIKIISNRILKSSDHIVNHNPINPGKLHNIRLGSGKVSDTFRSGTYLSYTNKKPIKLYRVYSAPDNVGHMSPYWSKIKPKGPTQVMIDNALDPAWGNRATKWIEIELPTGNQIYEGASASIIKQGNLMSEFAGGGNQIYLDFDIKSDWIVTRGDF
jgi:hypothetical protein